MIRANYGVARRHRCALLDCGGETGSQALRTAFAGQIAVHLIRDSRGNVLWRRKGELGKTRVARMETILKRYTVIPGTYDVAKQYGLVKRYFRDQVDENDMWIAATALAHELAIITNNLRHFEPMSERFGFSLVHPNRL